MPMLSLPATTSLILGAWVVVTIVLFARLDGRAAALIAMIGGWALLPNLEYPEEMLVRGRENFGTIHAVAIASAPWWNKASAIGLGCLLGSVLFGWGTLRLLRWRWFDAPMALWIALPVVSALANGRPLDEGLAMSRHLGLGWGVPYLIGRAWFASPEGLRDANRAWVLAGLVTAVLAALEFLAGPFWYSWTYGGHPYRFDGADRWVGHRPLTLLEHGNQFGMWAATAAVAAAWLWGTGHEPTWGLRRLGIPGGMAVLILVGACLLWQSHGAVILMLLALGLLLLRPRGHRSRWQAAVIWSTLLLAGGLGVGAAGLVASRGVENLRGEVRSVFQEMGKKSFTWRLARAEDQVDAIRQRPVLGWGRADWSPTQDDGTFTFPVALSFWLLTVGMYGGVGVAVSAGLLLLPLFGAMSRLRGQSWGGPPLGAVAAAVAVVGVNVADLLLNSGLLLPLMLSVGGLAGWSFDRGGPASAR